MALVRKTTLRFKALPAESFACGDAARRRGIGSLRLKSGALCLALALIVTALAAAGATPATTTELGAAQVTEIIDGDTVVLDHDIDGMREVRLVGTQAPKLPLGRSGFEAWPLAGAARDTLDALVSGRRVELRATGRSVDRHRRLLAHLYRDDGLWVQGEMLRAGMARVYTFDDNRALAADMLALEGEARDAGRGIWAHPFYAIRATDRALLGELDTFQIVEGRVLKTARVGRYVYLNFGPDYRTDFTASIATKLLPLFEQAGVDPLALEQKTVRVRGWIDSYNGPSIRVTHPEQIERVDQPAP